VVGHTLVLLASLKNQGHCVGCAPDQGAGVWMQVPLMKVAVLIGVSAWVVVSDSLKETVPCGSLRYWGLVLSLLPCIAVVTVEMRRHLLWKGHVKAAAGHLRADGECHVHDASFLLLLLLLLLPLLLLPPRLA
jgi:hypothetical protein